MSTKLVTQNGGRTTGHKEEPLTLPTWNFASGSNPAPEPLKEPITNKTSDPLQYGVEQPLLLTTIDWNS